MRNFTLSVTFGKKFRKRDNLQFKKTLFDSYVWRYMYLNFIYICHFQMAKKNFIIVKFCNFNISKCGAVVESKARIAGDSGSRPACVCFYFLPFSTDDARLT